MSVCVIVFILFYFNFYERTQLMLMMGMIVA